MKITDQEVIKILMRVRLYELSDMLADYPEDERDGRSDMQMLADEAGYLLDTYLEYGNSKHDWLNDCRNLLSKTQYGKRNFLDIKTFQPVYKDYEIQEAKDCVNSFNRLKRLVKSLEEKGYPSKWI